MYAHEVADLYFYKGHAAVTLRAQYSIQQSELNTPMKYTASCAQHTLYERHVDLHV
jgi:hypothetical protein